MKKALHIITGLNNGGAEGVLYRLIKYNNQDYENIVISLMDSGKYGEKLKALSVSVYFLNIPRGTLPLSKVVTLWKLIREIKPDIVQTWMYHADFIGGVVSRLAGINNIFWGIRNSSLSSQKTKLSTCSIVKVCSILSHVIPRKIVSCAENATRSHQKLGYSKKRFVTIPNGYDIKQFSHNQGLRNKLHEELDLPNQIPILGMVGRFDPQKDHNNLTTALGKLHPHVDFRCLLVGKGISSDNTELTGWIRQHNLDEKILLLGQRDDIPTVMNGLDIHILSSAYGEAFPNVLAEAMACGTPCITTNVGDASNIVGNTGWVIPPENSQALKEAIIAAITEQKINPHNWKSRQLAARQRIVDSFSIEKMVSAYYQAWEKE